MPDSLHLARGARLSSGSHRLLQHRYDDAAIAVVEDAKDLYRQILRLGSTDGYQGNFAREVRHTIAVLVDIAPASECALNRWLQVADDCDDSAIDEPFLRDAIRLDAAGRTDAALDVIYGAVDQLMKSGQFSALDAIISSLNADSLSADLLLAVLTATLPAKTRLPARREFLTKAEATLRTRGEFEPGLLTGL